MIFKKKVRVALGAVLLLAVILGLSLGNAYAREVDRIVTVTAAADEKFRNFWGPNYYWKIKVRGAIKEASRAFREQFGIGFEIERFVEWDSEDTAVGFDVFVEIMEEIPPGDSEIVITFTGQSNIGIGYTGAACDQLGRYVIVVDNMSSIGWFEKLYKLYKESDQIQKEGFETWRDWCVKVIAPRLRYETTTLVHELGHLFGTDETIEPHSVMSLTLQDTTKFDKENQRIIFWNKYTDFRKVEEFREQAAAYVSLAKFCLKQAQEEESLEEQQELSKRIAEYLIKAAELYIRAGFSWENAMNAAVAYHGAGDLYSEVTRQTEKAQEAFKKAGTLYLEVAKGYERRGAMDFVGRVLELYKRAGSCFELAGCKEKAEEAYRKFEEIKEEFNKE